MVFFDYVYGFCDEVGSAFCGELVCANAPEIESIDAHVGYVLYLFFVCFHRIVYGGDGAHDDLNFAALFLVFTKYGVGPCCGVDDECVYAVGFGEGESLEDLLFGVVLGSECVNVFEVSAVGVVREEVAAEEESAYGHVFDLACGESVCVGGCGMSNGTVHPTGCRQGARGG